MAERARKDVPDDVVAGVHANHVVAFVEGADVPAWAPCVHGEVRITAPHKGGKLDLQPLDVDSGVGLRLFRGRTGVRGLRVGPIETHDGEPVGHHESPEGKDDCSLHGFTSRVQAPCWRSGGAECRKIALLSLRKDFVSFLNLYTLSCQRAKCKAFAMQTLVEALLRREDVALGSK